MRYRDLVAPFLTVLFTTLSTGFYFTFLSLRLINDGHGEEAVGYVHAAYFLGMLLGSLWMDRVIIRIGHSQCFSAFGSLLAASIAYQALFIDVYSWMVARFVAGVSLAALYIVVESLLLAKASPKVRGTVLAWYLMVLYLAASVSQQFLEFLDVGGQGAFFVAAFFASVGIIPMALSLQKVDSLEKSSHVGMWELFVISPFGTWACIVSGILVAALYSFLPVFAKKIGLSPADIMTWTIAGGVVVQWPVGKISDYLDRRKTMMWLCVATAVGAAIQGWFVTEGFWAYVVAFVVGGLAYALWPLSMAQVCDHLDNTQITSATAMLLIVYGIGSVVGPPAAAKAMGWLDPQGLFAFYLAWLIPLIVLGLVMIWLRPPLSGKKPYEVASTETPRQGV